MRIELPPVTWADATHRAEDDAHTMTLASQPITEWAMLGEDQPALPLRVEISPEELSTVTLTF